MATYASEILNSDDYRNAIKEAMAKDCRYEDEHDGFENFSADSDHWLVIAEMLDDKATLITELVDLLEDAVFWDPNDENGGEAAWLGKVEAALTKAKGSEK